MRSLVTIFLKKKGKRFDPLIDLPDEAGISNEIEQSIKAGEQYSIGTIKVGGLGDYAKRFGSDSAMVILRLISQLLQDRAKSTSDKVFVGFLDSEVFVIAGQKRNIETAVEQLRGEFTAVLPFILQDEGFKSINLDIEIFESKEVPKLELIYEESKKEKILERRNRILKSKGASKSDIGSYTYDEIRQMFGNDELDIKITRDNKDVKLQVSKDNKEDAK